MGYSIGYDHNHKRDIGYGVPSICDHPDCDQNIDRGLSYVCGTDPYGGENGCGLFFCSEHLHIVDRDQLCINCCNQTGTQFEKKPDTEEWCTWKLNHDSWARWRLDFPDEVIKLKQLVEQHMSNVLIPGRFVVCAACKYGDIIVCGPRHHDDIMASQLDAMNLDEVKYINDGNYQTGFVDQHGTFMDRYEALEVAIAAGQINTRCKKIEPGDMLYSEDLY